MTADNMPILYQNIRLGLSTELGFEAFLWATERPGEDRMCYRAEQFAHEVEKIVSELTPMLGYAAQLHGQELVDPDLMAFVLKRHANWRFGGNQNPTYAVLPNTRGGNDD